MKDWTEDFEHENGMYQNRCRTCNELFIGYKRRMTCKECATKQVSVEPEVSVKTAGTKEIDVWRIEAKGVGSAYYEHDLSIVEDMLKSCDYEEGYIITKHKMDKAKYEALPEFTGF